ncbi:HipA domain-containing protein [Metasolibacillus meyeri]|uniref:HipA domain-containing protein n=1 Tax=Metasolibacillus meyeri TaxID=1071052 RepID=A0AAW9NHD2_9BACL|nr:HipA domain-containing protein [Metasolibacillus meyeri]MEC1177122.1 HipA domain-containing protein [Metasolibacillus meyeri]
METIHIPADAVRIISTSSKGDQSKWRVGDKWVKQNTRGYEGQAEVLASFVLAHSTLQEQEYVKYYPCKIVLPDGETFVGCYSHDFRGTLQEVTLERLFEANFTSTDPILNDKSLSTHEKFEQIMQQVQNFTDLNVRQEIARLLAFDALILNEDRHTNNILFLYNPVKRSWQLAPIFDNGLSLLSDERDYPSRKPLTILKRKVKAKPFNSSFLKQIALYTGPAFIDKAALLDALESSKIDFGRAKQVLLSQLNDLNLKHFFIERGETND